MLIGTYVQQPADTLDYDIPYTLADDDALDSVAHASSPAGLTVSSLVVGDSVKLWVSDGVAGTTYKVEVTATTTGGRVKQDEIRIKIKEY